VQVQPPDDLRRQDPIEAFAGLIDQQPVVDDAGEVNHAGQISVPSQSCGLQRAREGRHVAHVGFRVHEIGAVFGGHRRQRAVCLVAIA